MTTPHTSVTSTIGMNVIKDARLAFAVAVADRTPVLEESLRVTIDGEPVQYEEVLDNLGTRFHTVTAKPGALRLEYKADVAASAPPMDVTPADMLLYKRPSRYAESDRFLVMGSQLFGDKRGQELIDAVGDWVFNYLRYIPGTSGSEDSAIDTMLAGQGVCRDFTHLTIALLRANGIPSRVAAVYAPGLYPMDFHLVVEAALDGRWQTIDPTRKAPRDHLIRIATGRDAADTAFLSVLSGRVNFGPVQVTAYYHGTLPVDDYAHPSHL